MHSPIEQFRVKNIGPDISVFGIDISFTNSSLFMFLSAFLVILLVHFGTRKKNVIPTRLQSLVEQSYDFVLSMVTDTISKDKGLVFFPLIYSIFMFFLFGNLLGIIPGSFTFNSQLVVTVVMAVFIVGLVTVIGFIKHGFKFLKIFVPSGVPIYILVILVPIEIVSYLSRVVSLSVRLFANMMAGHTMMKIFAGFVATTGIFGILPLTVNIGVIGFEIFVACVQSYIFSVLACVYLNDAVNLH